MKKLKLIFSLSIMLSLLFLFSGLVSANADLNGSEDVNNEVLGLYSNGITDSDLNSENSTTKVMKLNANEIIDQDLKNYSSSIFALKIRLVHLQNSLDLKIEQLKIIIDTLNKNDIENEDLDFYLNQLIILNDELTSRTEMVDSDSDNEYGVYFVSVKQESNEIISNAKQIISEIADPILLSEIKSKVNDYKPKIKLKNKQKIKDLIVSHNQEIRNRYKKVIIDQIKSKAKTQDLKNITDHQKDKIKLDIRKAAKLEISNQINMKVHSQQKYVEDNKSKLEQYKHKRQVIFSQYKDELSNLKDSDLTRFQKIQQAKKNLNMNVRNNLKSGDLNE